MPRVAVYPQWVRDQVPPGHSVKRNGNQYYLYKTKSVYVPGKKNPQPESKYVGVITKEGIRYSSRHVVDTDIHPEWFEYGFSKCVYDMCFDVLIKDFKTQELTEEVVLNVIRQLSPRSFLLRGKTIASAEELHICICNQIKKIETKKKIRFEDLAILKDILLIEMDERKIITAANDDQEELIKRLEVNLYDGTDPS